MKRLTISKVWPALEGDIRLTTGKTFYHCLEYNPDTGETSLTILNQEGLVTIALEYLAGGGQVVFGTESGAFAYSPPNAKKGEFGVFYYAPIRSDFQDDLVRAFQKASPLPNFNF